MSDDFEDLPAYFRKSEQDAFNRPDLLLAKAGQAEDDRKLRNQLTELQIANAGQAEDDRKLRNRLTELQIAKVKQDMKDDKKRLALLAAGGVVAVITAGLNINATILKALTPVSAPHSNHSTSTVAPRLTALPAPTYDVRLFER